MIDALKAAGATLMSNSQLVAYLLGAQPKAGTTYFADSISGAPADFRPGETSPLVEKINDLGAEYKYDLLGIDQTRFGSGWEIGPGGSSCRIRRTHQADAVTRFLVPACGSPACGASVQRSNEGS